MAIAGLICLMMPAGQPQFTAGGAANRDFNYRIPAAWNPENENSYALRAYMADVAIWIMLTDLQPHHQCAAIAMRRGGAARDIARMITPSEMMNGGMQNGALVDPATYLLGALHARFQHLRKRTVLLP